jgi:GrpB-like predicted nucleotidyltransferase (UPF0157 family)
MRRDRIKIVPYDETWPALFEEQRPVLEGLLRPWLRSPVEHIGSTAVPGLAAKPIIDMLAVIGRYEDFASALPRTGEAGWIRAPEPGDDASRQYSLCYPNIARRSHHLHVVEASSAAWPSWLAFRDYLRDHPASALEYGQLKRRLAEADDQDRPRYRAAKAPFIGEILRKSSGE